MFIENTATQQQQTSDTETADIRHRDTHAIPARTHESDSIAASRPPTATQQWQKTSIPACYIEGPSGKWRLFLNLSQRPRAKAIRKPGLRFDSKEEAMAAMMSCRMSWEYSVRGRRFNPTETNPLPSSTSAGKENALPAGKYLVANCVDNTAVNTFLF